MSDDPTLSRLELLQGTLDFIILQTLRWGPRQLAAERSKWERLTQAIAALMQPPAEESGA